MNLIYVADPMCSWCYGFGVTLDALLTAPGDAAPLQLAIVMGGLRPFTKEPLDPARADEIAGHWRHVAEATGRPFADGPQSALRAPGFVYDTEPASRAVVTVRHLAPRLTWRYLEAVQHAFYAGARDVTQADVLADVAENLGLQRADFARAFASEPMRAATLRDFTQTHEWGIRGFPALLAEHDDHLHLVTHGHVPIDTLRERLAGVATAHGPA
ncbi:DsbA family protein [Piscinibacter koreensis]|uniref:DsbA family protein n=1 Tax=Piscinibacter koreensis TaxID=2742824 RepID=A0A7Y6NLI4_9BURK|nr:DsbA family protein [Schlegelella koreensis]NUZ05334.1 DsbA family protein [Schlegelella koreensis]